MADRVLLGRLPDGSYGLRVSRPGYSVQGEPLGSQGIAFDSRLNDFGLVHQQGLMGLGTISFPELPFIPLATIARIDGNNAVINNDVVATAIGSALHWSTPFVGIITTSTLEVRPMTIDYYTPSFPVTRWLYTVYAIEVG